MNIDVWKMFLIRKQRGHWNDCISTMMQYTHAAFNVGVGRQLSGVSRVRECGWEPDINLKRLG